MKENLSVKEKYKDIEDFFAAPPDAEEKAWHVIHMFYHEILTIMEKQKIKKVDIAKKLGKTKSLISQLFNNTPNISILKMVELADAIGADVQIKVTNKETKALKIKDVENTNWTDEITFPEKENQFVSTATTTNVFPLDDYREGDDTMECHKIGVL